MTTLAKTIRLTCDRRRAGQVIDAYTNQRPTFFRGNTLAFEIGLFAGSEIIPGGDITSITFQVKAPTSSGGAPSPADPALMQAIVEAGDIDTTVDGETWDNQTKQHATVEFDDEESNISAGVKWLVISAVLSGGEIVTFLAGLFAVQEDGFGNIAPPDPIDNFLNLALADGRYLSQANPQATLDAVKVETPFGEPFDGTYVRAGDVSGRPRYQHLENPQYSFEWTGSRIELLDDQEQDPILYADSPGSRPWDVTTWKVFDTDELYLGIITQLRADIRLQSLAATLVLVSDEATLAFSEILVDAFASIDDDAEFLLATSTLAPGREMRLRVVNTDTSPVDLTWPAAIKWVGGEFLSIPAETEAIVSLWSTSDAAAGVRAAYVLVD